MRQEAEQCRWKRMLQTRARSWRESGEATRWKDASNGAYCSSVAAEELSPDRSSYLVVVGRRGYRPQVVTKHQGPPLSFPVPASSALAGSATFRGPKVKAERVRKKVCQRLVQRG